MTEQLAISVRGLRKGYRGAIAVAGIDLDVAGGEVFALLGPNGAGKTTAVEILEGYRHRDAGAVSVLGQDPGTASGQWRARIGVVLQGSAGIGELTVAEVVRHFATFYPRPRDPDDVIAAVGLAAQRKARPRELSGGQRRRLDVALGIIGDPELLFLDEPTTGFDPEARREFWTLIKTLAQHGTTILLTTHYLDEAEALADRVGVLAAGRLVAVAPPHRLGDRDRLAATVRWRDGGRMRVLETGSPTEVVAALASQYHGEVPDLSVTRPSLEDSYLRLITAPSPKEREKLRTGNSGATEVYTEQADTDQADTDQTDTDQTDTGQADTGRPDTKQPDTGQPFTEQPDTGRHLIKGSR